MPGATSLIAANQIYAMAKPDGLTLGVIAPALYFDQLVGRTIVNVFERMGALIVINALSTLLPIPADLVLLKQFVQLRLRDRIDLVDFFLIRVSTEFTKVIRKRVVNGL